MAKCAICEKVSGKSDTKVEKPTLTYRVYADGKWYNEVKGLSNCLLYTSLRVCAVFIPQGVAFCNALIFIKKGCETYWITQPWAKAAYILY